MSRATQTRPSRTRRPAPRELAHIVPDLHPLAVPTSSLEVDPRNARRHDPRSIAEITRSLQTYQQRKPIVYNRRTGLVIAGNGTLEAFRAAGWKWIAAVGVEDDPTTAAGYSIADNRTAELSEWDEARLQELLAELEAAGVSSVEVGFTQEELSALIAEGTAAAEQTAPRQRPAEIKPVWAVLIECRDEAEQLALLEEMQAAGRTCRALIV